MQEWHRVAFIHLQLDIMLDIKPILRDVVRKQAFGISVLTSFS